MKIKKSAALITIAFFISALAFFGSFIPIRLASAQSNDDKQRLNESQTNCMGVQFDGAPELKAGKSPKAAAMADFDRDGKQDIASAFSYTSQGFSVMRNLGSNKFAPKVDFTLPANSDNVEAIYAQDLDNDSKPDIVLSAAFSNRIIILKNISSGVGDLSFSAPVTYTVGGYKPHAVAFGDFDGDGIIDIATVNQESPSGVSVLRNISATTGSLAFAPKVDFPFGQTFVLTTGDFDGDGKLDIAAAGNHNNGVYILRNNGNGAGDINFTLSPYFRLTGQATGIIARDLDSDGKTDIAASILFNNGISILRNSSSGTGNVNFAAKQDFSTGLFPSALVSEDFDGDGKIDIATVNDTNNNVSILRNTSSTPGNFSFAPRSWDYGAGVRPYRGISGDVNSDGKPDIITANLISETISVFLNDSTPNNISFNARRDYFTPGNAGVESLTAGDFDGDGKNDIAATFDEVRNVFKFSIYRNNGSGVPFTQIDVATPGSEAIYSAAADFDNDGKIDLATQTTTGLFVFLNTSSGTGNVSFSSRVVVNDNYPNRVWAADFDGDGRKDILATFRQFFGGNEYAIVYRNTSISAGAVSFAASQPILLSGVPKNIAIGDINSDGKKDFAYTLIQGSGSVTKIFINDGAASGQFNFSPYELTSSNVPLVTVAIGDLDGDGKEDLVTGDNYNVYFYKNTGAPGNFNLASPVVFRDLFLAPFEIADFDGDGKKDIVARRGIEPGSSISILKNTLTGGVLSLSPGESFAVNGGTNAGSNTSLIIADFDNNGKPDIASGYKSSFGAISILLNKTCQPRRTSFDFDGDGKADVSLFRPSNGTWYFNNSINGFSASQFGINTDKTVAADYDGDGKTDIAVYRDGNWFWLKSSDGSFNAVQFGQTGDIPVPADYNGDGQAEIAVYRGGTWFLFDKSNNQFQAIQFGISSDKPIPADFDGDGKTDIAVYRDGFWYSQQSSKGFTAVQFGNSSDIPIVGDFDGDGYADRAVFRTGFWYVLGSTRGFYGEQFGAVTDVPVPADYDGDGLTDIAVYRGGTWYIRNSGQGFIGIQFGTGSDKPISATRHQ